ncbi:MAG TPA: hypothetical protein VH189_03405, partial [Rhizomicrobium sp.]|nr:hypothetical protein [Rhizomicrobium sp.]
MSRFLIAVVLLLAAPVLIMPAWAEDGYDLWLRYRPIEAGSQAQYRPRVTVIVAPKETSPTL